MLRITLFGALLASLAPACFWVTTKHEGNELRKDMDGLELRVQAREGDLKSKIDQLEAVLDEATKVLKRNSADLGAEFASLSDQTRAMHGLITAAKTYAEDVRKEAIALKEAVQNDREVMTRRVESLEQRLAALEDQANKQPVSPDELWTRGKAALDAGDLATAKRLFRQLVASHPRHARASDAQFFRGEAHVRDNDLDGAIREFQKAFDDYQSSPRAPEALFRAGEAAQKLRRCAEARAYFGLLRQKYPRSSLVKRAQAKDAELRRDAKDKSKCLN